MCIEVMTMVWKSQGHFTSSEKIVLLYIADRGNYEGMHAYPSLSTLAKRCELGLSTVKRCITSLEKKKILKRANRTIEGRLTSNTYCIDLKLLELLVDNPVHNPCIMLLKKKGVGS